MDSLEIAVLILSPINWFAMIAEVFMDIRYGTIIIIQNVMMCGTAIINTKV